MNHWPSIPKKLPPKTLREFRGVNKLDQYTIADSYSTSQRNTNSDNYPALSVREGFSLVGTSTGQPVTSLGFWKNSEAHKISNGQWFRLIGGVWTSLLSGLSASAPGSLANFKGGFPDIYLISANGIDAPRVFDGSAVIALSGAPATGNYVISYSNRVFMAVGNLLYASGLNLATDWNSTGNDSSPYQISIDTVDGETINGLAPGIGHVTIFKPNSMHELFGSSPSDVRVEPITFEVGAINNQSIVTLNSAMYFIHRTGIYRYGGGTRPSRDFSQPVQDFIDTMNLTESSKCSAGTNGEKIFFSIPSSSAATPDTTLVYDPKYDMWNVYKDFTPLLFALSGSSMYIGLSDGRVIQPGTTTDNGTAIQWEWVSKPFGASSYSQKIRWTRMWIMADIPTGSILNAFVSPSPTGDSDWLSVGSISPSANVQNTRIMLAPPSAFSNYLRIKFSGSGPAKIHQWDCDEIQFPIV